MNKEVRMNTCIICGRKVQPTDNWVRCHLWGGFEREPRSLLRCAARTVDAQVPIFYLEGAFHRLVRHRGKPGRPNVRREKCGLRGGDALKVDVFKDTVIRLIAHVTARNLKRN